MAIDLDNRWVTFDDALGELEPRLALPPRDLADLIAHGVMTDDIDIDAGKGPTRWSKIRLRAVERAVVGASDFSLDDLPTHGCSSAYVGPSPVQRIKDAGISLSLKHAVMFLERHFGLIYPPPVARAVDSAFAETSSAGVPGPKRPQALTDLEDDLVAHMQDPDVGRLRPEEAIHWMESSARDRGFEARRGTLQPYRNRAFERYDRWVDRTTCRE